MQKKNEEIKIIQCKYWKKDKIIHEKHLFQLYGTSIVYMIEKEMKKKPKIVFITSCAISDMAKKVANSLSIDIIENKIMPDYPCIKCNISSNGEKIYHLPFDQQYDKIKIEPKKGELYCQTIEDAERAGFRRAFRWRGAEA